MGEIVNLRRVRKAMARQDAAREAAANRAEHGRTKAERDADAKRETLARKALDGARLLRDGEPGK